jgi:CubicO group peptidase (beta-lactamase class C family)
MATARRSTCRDFPGTVLRLGARLFLILALVGAGVGAESVHAATPSPGCAERLEPLVTALMIELGVPGLIVSIDAPTICRWTEALGVRDVAKHGPMRVNEYMRIASITKTLTFPYRDFSKYGC